VASANWRKKIKNYFQQCCKKQNITIFVPVNKRSTIWLQKLFAGYFLALFLFIHVAKALHHHDIKPITAKEIASEKQLVAKTACDICDYYFAKDADAGTTSTQLEPPAILSPLYTDLLVEQLTSVGLPSSDRGPPSI
jgi:hypothetical protein